MIQIKINCKTCSRKTTIVTRVNFEEDAYYCPICGSANTKIVNII